MGTPLTSGPAVPPGSELDRLRARVTRYFPVYETRVGPQSVVFTVHADPATLESNFRALADELWKVLYVPSIRRETGEYLIEVGHRPVLGPSRIAVNLALLAATIVSTVFTGALIWAAFAGDPSLTSNDVLFGALFFALPLMGMLGAHELAHYVVARRYRFDASLPYFMSIPPPFLFGTLGAFISIRQPFTDRKALFDIGAAGPIAGFAIAVPVTLAGMFLSVSGPLPSLAACGPSFLGTDYSNLIIGVPAIWYAFDALFPSGVLSLHPLALAGWVGIFVTSINLLPAGQLDGGHVWRALFRDSTRYFSYAVAIFLLVIGLFFYFGWLVFAFLVIFLGLRHPAPLNDVSPLGWRRILIALGVVAILLVGFTLVPVAEQTGQLNPAAIAAHSLAPPPGYAVAGNLSVNVTNADPVPHGLVLFASVMSVVLANGSSPLNSTALERWASTSNWTFVIENVTYTVSNSANASVAGASGYITLNGLATLPISITYLNVVYAYSVSIALSVSEVCPAPSSGPASIAFPAIISP